MNKLRRCGPALGKDRGTSRRVANRRARIAGDAREGFGRAREGMLRRQGPSSTRNGPHLGDFFLEVVSPEYTLSYASALTNAHAYTLHS
jgi:hypothetical protein